MVDVSPASPGVERAEPERTPKRGSIACRRCRRLRIKCLNDGAESKNPCQACQKLGESAVRECVYPKRGEKDIDREYRNSRKRSVAAIRESLTTTSNSPSSNEHSDWHLLPPLDDVLEACKYLTKSYFQLGFLPKALFFDKLSRDPKSISVFFLLSVLSLSARFTPSLVASYGSGFRATEIFMHRATKLVPQEMYQPSLERTQAFFLLAVAQWGHGDKNHSSIHMAIAVRMAGMLRLHREETYCLGSDAVGDDVVNAETARRTFWMIASQDNLHSGPNTPASFSLGDITALLPCEEHEYAFGSPSKERAVLSGTRAHVSRPDLANSPSRSLFASLIQVHDLWGRVSRQACRRGDDSTSTGSEQPWNTNSQYRDLANALHEWEMYSPRLHQWSRWNLMSFKEASLELAYLSVVMVLRLSNIVLRSIYLEEMMLSKQEHSSGSHPQAPPGFWESMINTLFENVLELHEQIQTFFPSRSSVDGSPPIMIFCVYICGTLATYLWIWPDLCPTVAPQAESIFESCLAVLDLVQHNWPMAVRWQESLRKAAAPSGTSTELPTQGTFMGNDQNSDEASHTQNHYSITPPFDSADAISTTAIGHPANDRLLELSAVAGDQLNNFFTHPATAGVVTNEDALPSNILAGGLFSTGSLETELLAFLGGDINASSLTG